jgi:hypothetical protein
MRAERIEPVAVSRSGSELGGDQDLAAQRLTQGFDASGFVDCRPDHGEVEPIGRAYIAVQHLPDVQREVDFPASARTRLTQSSARIASFAAVIAARQVSASLSAISGKLCC